MAGHVMTDEPRWSAKKVSVYLDKSPTWVYDAANKGILPFVWVGGEKRFDPEVVRALGRGEVVGDVKIVRLGRGKRGNG